MRSFFLGFSKFKFNLNSLFGTVIHYQNMQLYEKDRHRHPARIFGVSLSLIICCFANFIRLVHSSFVSSRSTPKTFLFLFRLLLTPRIRRVFLFYEFSWRNECVFVS